MGIKWEIDNTGNLIIGKIYGVDVKDIASSSLTWVDAPVGTILMQPGVGYILNSAGDRTFYLPAASPVNARNAIRSIQGSFTIYVGESQSLTFGSTTTIVTMQSTKDGDCLNLQTIVSDTVFQVESSVGNFNIEGNVTNSLNNTMINLNIGDVTQTSQAFMNLFANGLSPLYEFRTETSFAGAPNGLIMKNVSPSAGVTLFNSLGIDCAGVISAASNQAALVSIAYIDTFPNPTLKTVFDRGMFSYTEAFDGGQRNDGNITPWVRYGNLTYTGTGSDCNTDIEYLPGVLSVTFNQPVKFNNGIVDGANLISIDSNSRNLIDNTGTINVDWQARTLNAALGAVSLDWQNRVLNDSATLLSIDYENHYLNVGTRQSIDWQSSILYDANSLSSVEWNNRIIRCSDGTSAAHWEIRLFFDNTGNQAIDWQNRLLQDATSVNALDWTNRIQYDAAVAQSILWNDRLLMDNSGTTISINWDQRYGAAADGSTAMHWNTRTLIDSAASDSVRWEARTLIDGGNGLSIDWGNRQLKFNAIFTALDWSNTGVLDGSTAVFKSKGLQVVEGANATQGVATLVAGTVTVSNTSVTANSRIFLTAQDNNTIGSLRISARNPGTDFTITSSVGVDNGVVAWEIFEPA